MAVEDSLRRQRKLAIPEGSGPRRFPGSSPHDRPRTRQKKGNNRMKHPPKTLSRSPRPTLAPTAEQWQAVRAAIRALNTALEPVVQPLTAGEIRDLLRVGIANEALTRDYVALLEAHPGLLPGYLHAADTRADWRTRDELVACGQAIGQISEKIAATAKALQSDCCAAALSAYRVLVMGGIPAGHETTVAPLRAHIEKRVQRRRETRAKNLALNAAREALGEAGGGTAPAATPAAAVIEMKPVAASPRSGAVPVTLAA